MANYARKQKVNVAVSKNNKFNLSRKVVTTSDFGRIKPIECKYMVPGDSFNYKVSHFTRLLPMPAPTFGKIEMIQRAFFVPIRTILPEFNHFISGNYASHAGAEYTCGTAVISLGSIYQVLCDPENSENADVSMFDFWLDDDLRTDKRWQRGYYKLTLKGRKIYDFLISLGLNIHFDSAMSEEVVSALPILAYWKTYIDWVVPSRFIQDIPNIMTFINCLHPWDLDNSDYASYIASNGNDIEILPEHFKSFLTFAIPYFSNDFFTSAWRQPYIDGGHDPLPAIRTENNVYVSTKDIVQPDPTESALGSGAVTTNATGSSLAQPHNYITIETLGRLQDFLNRGLLAGSKIQDWLLTEFGMRPSTDALQLSTYLGSNKSVIRIGDVTSTSDTFDADAGKGSYLGQYAGKAMADGVDTFKYSAKEHGFFIITSELIPETSYYQGLTPEFMMRDRLSFFQPEFDGIGVDPIARKQLFFDSHNIADDRNFNPNGVFGFTPRYSSLKTSFDTVGGNFRLPTMAESLRPWWLARDMRPNIDTAWINDIFAKMSPEVYNYDYIFSYEDPDVDHFYQIFLLENQASRPMLSLEEAFNPEHPNGSKSVVLNANGNIANN